MSQSEAHRELVIQAADALIIRYPHIRILTDLQKYPGDEVPPTISGYRPDIYANKVSSSPLIVSEAKTDRDLDNKHTHQQITSFIRYLDLLNDSLFVLSVSGRAVDHAKTFMRFLFHTTKVKYTRIEIYDGCDFWLLVDGGGISWHLGYADHPS